MQQRAGRLVLVMCCAIRRCSCLFLITYLIGPAYTAGVLVEKNKTRGCMFMRAFSGQGVRNASVFIMDPHLPTVAPSGHSEEGERSRLSSLSSF